MSDLNIVDLLFVAMFRESIRAFIPNIISLFNPPPGYYTGWYHITVPDALAKLAEQGKVSKFLT